MFRAILLSFCLASSAGSKHILFSISGTVADVPIDPQQSREMSSMAVENAHLDILAAAGETLEAATLRECLTSAGVDTLPHLSVQVIDTRAASAVCPSFVELCGMASTVENDLRQLSGYEDIRLLCEEDHTFYIQGFMTHEDGILGHPDASDEAAFASEGGSKAFRPNDPLLSRQYGMKKINMDKVWGEQVGSKDIVVAVIDTGVDYTHEDLQASMWKNPNEIPDNGIDDDNNGFIDDVYGWNFAANNNNPMDDNNHGTHCAGVIGAQTDNGIGVAGINRNVRIMALKFLSAWGGGSMSDALSALEYAIDNGAQLSSNSYGCRGCYSELFQTSLDRADAKNHIFVAAAGNDASDCDQNEFYPCNYPNKNNICVASSDQQDNFSVFSNYGAKSVHVIAPGTDIASTVPNNQYASMSGTSMACPHVAGVVALMKSVTSSITGELARRTLMDTSADIESMRGKCGAGRIRADYAVTSAASQKTAMQSREGYPAFNATFYP